MSVREYREEYQGLKLPATLDGSCNNPQILRGIKRNNLKQPKFKFRFVRKFTKKNLPLLQEIGYRLAICCKEEIVWRNQIS